MTLADAHISPLSRQSEDHAWKVLKTIFYSDSVCVDWGIICHVFLSLTKYPVIFKANSTTLGFLGLYLRPYLV